MSTADNGGRPEGSAAPAPASARRATSGATAPVPRTKRPVGGSPLRRVSPMRDTERPEPGSSAPTTPVPVTPRSTAGQSAPRTTASPSTTSPSTAAGSTAGQNGQASQPAEQQAPRAVTPTPQAQPRPASARRVRLTVSRVDPWSAMKISFLLSVALGIAGVVMVAVLWTILNGMGVFDQVNGVVGQIVQDNSSRFDVLDFIGFKRVVSLAIVIGVIDVILVTAIATLGAFLYNVSSALVGGLQLTLTDD